MARSRPCGWRSTPANSPPRLRACRRALVLAGRNRRGASAVAGYYEEVGLIPEGSGSQSSMPLRVGLRLCELPRMPTFRDCPKSLGRVCGVALRAAEKLLLAHFALFILAKSTLGALLEPLFGQSL